MKIGTPDIPTRGSRNNIPVCQWTILPLCLSPVFGRLINSQITNDVMLSVATRSGAFDYCRNGKYSQVKILNFQLNYFLNHSTEKIEFSHNL